MKISGISEKLEQAIIDTAKRYNIEKLIVFGSRARGDYKRTSDIDLAVCGGNISAFAMEIEESLPTLLTFDVVNLSGSVQPQLLESIRKEGILLYEKV